MEMLVNRGGTKPLAHLIQIGLLMLLFAIAPPAAADPYLGGIDLTTANGTYGTVTGDLWFDAYPGFDSAYTTPVFLNSTLPCNPDDVAWARLYVDVYIGHMENNYPLKVTTKFDGDGAGGSDYVTLGSEVMDTTYTFPYNEGSWDGEGPIWINDHCNRVTSDFLIWYDVDNSITSSSVSSRVNVSKPDGTEPLDGRVKMITLVVAYNNQSCKVTHYWVNPGHDTDSYRTDDEGYPYTGNTTFNTSAVYSPGEANLTVLPLASFNGNYTFNNNQQLTWANPHQGAYFAWQSWDVTNLISSGINSYMTYGRNEDDSRPLYSGYFKIPLTLLTVEDESYIYDFSKNTLGRAGTGLLAYKSQTSSLPSTVNNDPNNEFSATEYGKLKYDDQDFQSDVTATNNKRAAHRFVFNVSCCSNIANLDAINVTWNGKGYHDDGGTSNGAYLYIWNGTGYESLDDCDGIETEQYLTGEKTANLGNYINNNQVIVLAEQKTAQFEIEEGEDLITKQSHIETDYVKLVLKQ